MKFLSALLVLGMSSVALASYTPDVAISVGNDKSVYVQITNDSGVDLECKYSVSWFVNTLSYHREFGHIIMPVGAIAQLSYMNDQYSHLSKIKAKVLCE